MKRYMILCAVLFGCSSSVDSESTTPPYDCPGEADACKYVYDIATAAKVKYETSGVLCETAVAAPSWFPAGQTREPSTEDGRDFLVGDETVGWRCLGYSVTEPMRFQLSYTSGVYPSSCALTPWVTGSCQTDTVFEAAAQGDLNNDSILSTYIVVGRMLDGKISLSEILTKFPDE